MAILAQPWPTDLDPKRVPYRTRTVTSLQRMGAWDDPTRFAELTIDEVAGFWVTGPVTITDLLDTSEAAIGWYLNESRELASVVQDDSQLAHIRPYALSVTRAEVAHMCRYALPVSSSREGISRRWCRVAGGQERRSSVTQKQLLVGRAAEDGLGASAPVFGRRMLCGIPTAWCRVAWVSALAR